MNLDAMTPESLLEFWRKYRTPDASACAELGFDVPTCKNLAAYAGAKARAMKLRLRGEISRALLAENYCETYYKSLPAAARW